MNVLIELSTLDPDRMSDEEHRGHFGFSRIDAAIDEEVQRRLTLRASRASPDELTEADREIAAQLGISLDDMARQKRQDAAIALSRGGDDAREQAIKDLERNFPGHSRAHYMRMIEGRKEA